MKLIEENKMNEIICQMNQVKSINQMKLRINPVNNYLYKKINQNNLLIKKKKLRQIILIEGCLKHLVLDF